MSFLAETECTIAAPLEVAFDRLADFAGWDSWMPRSFRPVAATDLTLHVGDRLRVKIGGAPFATRLEVSVLDRPREIAWRGGVRGVLRAEHRFLFEADGDGATRVRSVETWFGALTPIMRLLIQPMAVRIADEQLAGLAHGLRQAARD